MFDESSPGSWKQKLGPCDFLDCVETYYKTNKILFEMGERELWQWLKEHKMPVTVTDNVLRYRIWYAYDQAMANDVPLQIATLFSGVMTWEAFQSYYSGKPEKVAWLMCPPVSYEASMREALGFSTREMRDILELPNMEIDSKTGNSKPNIRLMELKAKIHAMLDMRQNGNFTQRIEQKTLTINASGAGRLVQKYTESGSLDALQDELDQLSEKERKVLNLPPKKKVEPVAVGSVIDVTLEPQPTTQKDF